MNEVLHHFVELITDPAHTLVEFTYVLVDVLIIRAIAKRWEKRRDRRHGHA